MVSLLKTLNFGRSLLTPLAYKFNVPLQVGALSTKSNPSKSSEFEFTLENSVLSIDQRQFYEENGYLVVKNLVDGSDLEKYTRRFKEIANGKVKVPGLVVQKDIAFVKEERNENTVYKLQELFMDEILFEYCKYGKILDYAECFCGPNLMAIHTMLINKPPDSGTKSTRHPLHQDLLYFPIRPANRIVCAWTAIERVSRANGCLVALPGTHKTELHDHGYPEWEGGVNKMYHGIKDISRENRIHLEMDAGDTVFFHPLLVHGSGTNRTQGYRKAISCHYSASDCHYIDTKGTKQEELSNEIVEVARKRGIEVDDIRVVWKLRAQLVRGIQINI